MDSSGCYRLFRDGDRWVAKGPPLTTLGASPAGYGRTYQEAIEDLVRQPPFQDWLRASGQSQPSLADFVVDQCPPKSLPRDRAIAEAVSGEVGNIVRLRNTRRARG